MARPSSRLDIYLVPPESEVDPIGTVRSRFAASEGSGCAILPGVVPAAVRVDDPGKPVLYGNQGGGFHVTCSHCGAGLARVFRPLERTPCPGCGRALPFAEVCCRPPAAVGSAALVLVDVDQAVTTDPEGWTVVLRRV